MNPGYAEYEYPGEKAITYQYANAVPEEGYYDYCATPVPEHHHLTIQ